MNKIKSDVIKGVFWKFSERFSAQIVSLTVSIVLARLLLPSEYGIISIVMVFVTIANVFVTSGLGASLIQKIDADEIDFSSVFYFNLLFSSLLYIGLFISSSYIAEFYKIPILEPVLKVLGISIVLLGINSVQQAYVSRRMIFKKFFYATLLGTVSSAIVGIALAYMGYGVWALVSQNLTNIVIDTIVLQLSIEWKPVLNFSFKRLKALFNYGWKLLIQNFVLQIYSSLRSLLIGKIYTTSDLAYYTKGNQFPDLISSNIDTAINSALFPAMSKEQKSIERVKQMARKTTQVTSYVMNPILVGFMAIAEPFISLLLTDKWIPAVPFLRICCIVLLFRAPQTAILQATKAVGRSDCVLMIDFPIRLFALIVLLISVKFGVIYIALTELLVTVFGTILYGMMSNSIIGYSGKEIISDFKNNTIIAGIMGITIWGIGVFLPISNSLKIFVMVILGIVIYIFLSIITNNPSFKFVLNTAKEIAKSRRK